MFLPPQNVHFTKNQYFFLFAKGPQKWIFEVFITLA